MDRAALIARLKDTASCHDETTDFDRIVVRDLADAVSALEADRTKKARLEKIEARAQSFRVSRNFNSAEINNVTHFILTGDTDG